MTRIKDFLMFLACRARAKLFSYMTGAGLILCDVDPTMVKTALDGIGDDMEQFKSPYKEKLSKAVSRIDELQSQLADIEQKQARGPGRSGSGPTYSAGAQIADALSKSPMFEAMQKGEIKSFAVRVPMSIKANVVSASAIVSADRDSEIQAPLFRALRIRDLIVTLPTSQGSVEFTRELAFTDGAAIQANEGDVKGESGLTFELVEAPVRTNATWIPASRQVLDDRIELAQYIENRLLYALALKEEAQILLGAGTGSDLHGVYTQATAYSAPFVITSPTPLDTPRLAITQLQVANAAPTGIVLNPIDWGKIETNKSDDGNYLKIVTDMNGRAVAWRVPVVVSNS